MIIRRFKNPATKGFTLTEAAIVLGIVGLILGAIWVAASAVYNNMRVEAANKQLMTIVQNVRSLYATSTQMDNATTAQLASAGVFPSDTNPGSGAPQNSWGGNITVARNAAGAGLCPTIGDCFSVSFAGVPQGPCIKMGVANGGQGRDSGLVGISNAAVTAETNVGANATPANFLGGPCSAATGNTIVFTFRLKG